MELYKLCFIHKSSLKTAQFGCNERLEFLGDAILDSVTADYLYIKFPNEKEGVLSEMRSRIVNRRNMNCIGIDLQLQKHLLARIPHLKQNDAIGNCLEALIGAIYKDRGYKKAKEFIINRIIQQHTNIKQLPKNETNSKSSLQIYCQRDKLSLTYNTYQIEGEKFPFFKSEVIINNNIISEATGKSKKIAEQAAAKLAIKALHFE
ncbi:MAG: putative dsRNA-binding protein [Bacteroidales bacterium]|nr:putative dsRNA-binding protein [Bacteroidales bacterium]